MYATNGEKFATLSITSGNQVITVSCGSVIVGYSTSQTFTKPTFGASCYATSNRAVSGENVTWLSIVSGTTASTTYAWDGTDGLSGDRPLISKTYTTSGTKAALLTVTNGAERVVTACTNAVSVGPRMPVTGTSKIATATTTNEIQGICVPSPTTARVADTVIWTVAAIGGTGAFEFLWSGDEALVATSASTTKVYRTEGAKGARVLIASGNRTVTLTCPSVEVIKGWKGLTASSLFSWMNGPVGFILALLLAIIIGILFARKKRAKEEREEEKDHEH